LESTIPEDYSNLFGQGSTPIADESKYPDKETLLSQLSQQHERVAQAYEASNETLLNEPNPNEDMRQVFPTKGVLLAMLLGSHEGIHAGQISVWRRALGKPTAVPGM
jgi:uncharacterized damage-inducible protein DinB